MTVSFTLAHMHDKGLSTKEAQTFHHKDLSIREARPKERRPLPKEDAVLNFGELYSDHMLDIDWSSEKGWLKPRIHPYEKLSLDPASKLEEVICDDKSYSRFIADNFNTSTERPTRMQDLNYEKGMKAGSVLQDSYLPRVYPVENL
ncbi:hypothetical protein DICVIV_10555 [Dictyocaulus viviparus]|uniref:Uncharacterized protein n=1 Tax=Dictyocaulus viviparus TaxID=29172 RepID=A0A0D8XM21_DICVI|nr:hypothetical protein DICVIV_10555 [Dictyocaulus viviparus]